jgi:hypothetical protein
LLQIVSKVLYFSLFFWNTRPHAHIFATKMILSTIKYEIENLGTTHDKIENFEYYLWQKLKFRYQRYNWEIVQLLYVIKTLNPIILCSFHKLRYHKRRPRVNPLYQSLRLSFFFSFFLISRTQHEQYLVELDNPIIDENNTLIHRHIKP